MGNTEWEKIQKMMCPPNPILLDDGSPDAPAWVLKNRRKDEAEALFNQFIRQWVAPSMQGHLLDNDDNDGERVRQAIRALWRT